jgi:hypothetical protein
VTSWRFDELPNWWVYFLTNVYLMSCQCDQLLIWRVANWSVFIWSIFDLMSCQFDHLLLRTKTVALQNISCLAHSEFRERSDVSKSTPNIYSNFLPFLSSLLSPFASATQFWKCVQLFKSFASDIKLTLT